MKSIEMNSDPGHRWLFWVLAAIVFVAMTAAVAQGDVPINGQRKVKAGQSAILSVPIDQAGEDYDWLVEPADTKKVDGQNRRETFLVILDVEKPVFVSFVSFDKKFHQTTMIELDGRSPPDKPDDTRPLPLPDGKFGLANATAAWVVSQVKVESRSKAKALADSFRQMVKTIASSQAAGVAWDREAILDATTKQNSEALGDQRDSWLEWATSLQVRLDQLYAAGSLKSADDYKQAFAEIAIGLESVK